MAKYGYNLAPGTIPHHASWASLTTHSWHGSIDTRKSLDMVFRNVLEPMIVYFLERKMFKVFRHGPLCHSKIGTKLLKVEK